MSVSGQLGLGDASDQEEPTYCDALRGVSVAQIACGSGHTVVLTTDGKVFSWGRGDDGRVSILLMLFSLLDKFAQLTIN